MTASRMNTGRKNHYVRRIHYPKNSPNFDSLKEKLDAGTQTMANSHTAAVVVNGQIQAQGNNSIRGLWQSHAETAAIARYLINKGFDRSLIEHLRQWWGTKPVWQNFATHFEKSTGISREDPKAFKLCSSSLYSNATGINSQKFTYTTNFPESRYFKRRYSQGTFPT